MTTHTDPSKEIEIPKQFQEWADNEAKRLYPKGSGHYRLIFGQEGVIKGAIAAFRHLHPSPSPSGWIEIKPGCEMPEIDEFVLWRTEEGNYFIKEIDKDDGPWWKGASDYGGQIWHPVCTHWSRIVPPTESVTA